MQKLFVSTAALTFKWFWLQLQLVTVDTIFIERKETICVIFVSIPILKDLFSKILFGAPNPPSRRFAFNEPF
jgi:hypothetical protein